MLDIKYVREHLDEVAETMKNRHASFSPEQFTALDVQRREVIAEEEALQAERNKLSKEIGALMGQGKTDEANATKETVRQINEKLTALGDARAEAEAAMDALMLSIPNMVDATTPVGEDESDNPEVRRWGTPRDFAAEGFEPQAHWDLGPALNIIDFERGVKLAESRFYVLGGAGARLERALIAFMLDQHTSRGYKEWWVPALANAATLTGTGQLPKFEEDLFHTTEGLYLIPTAEVQLTNLHAGEVLDADSLPLHYCAFTPCFREEAGSAGRDTRGIIRVHQFSKVEMVKFATPETGFDELESMVEDAENILQQLNVHTDSRAVVAPALEKQKAAGKPAAALQLPDGRIITGKASNLMSACSSCVLNAIKAIAGIDDSLTLISPIILEPILNLKIDILGSRSSVLKVDDVLAALSITAATNTLTARAMAALPKLRDCEMHSSCMLHSGDEGTLRKLGVRLTCEAEFPSKDLYF